MTLLTSSLIMRDLKGSCLEGKSEGKERRSSFLIAAYLEGCITG